MPSPAPAPAPADNAKQRGGLLGGLFKDKRKKEAEREEAPAMEMQEGASPADEASMARDSFASLEYVPAPAMQPPAEAPKGGGGVGLLEQQLASGLWAGSGAGAEPVRQARATALALLELLRQGITSTHAIHGAQVKKAVEALLALVPQLTGAPEVAELALGVAWLVAAGPRTRARITQAAQPLSGLSARLADEGALRQHVDSLATRG